MAQTAAISDFEPGDIVTYYDSEGDHLGVVIYVVPDETRTLVMILQPNRYTTSRDPNEIHKTGWRLKREEKQHGDR